MDESPRIGDVVAAAVGFGTRLPVGAIGTPDAGAFQRARPLLPLVGALVGTIGATVGYVALRVVGDTTVAALLAFGATACVTGALHEDGLGDVCDAIGGGTDRDRVLAIMRDSRLGSFGVLGLVFVTGLRVRLLASLLEHRTVTAAFSAFVATHVLARSAALLAMDRHAYARDAGSGANAAIVSAPFSAPERATYVLPAIVASLFAGSDEAGALLLVAVPLAVSLGLGEVFRRWIGGVTGDCLGAIEQTAEVAVLVVACAGAVR